MSHLLPRTILSTSEEACCRERQRNMKTAWARPPQPVGNMAAWLSLTQHKPNSERRLRVEGRITSAQSLHRAYTNIFPQRLTLILVTHIQQPNLPTIIPAKNRRNLSTESPSRESNLGSNYIKRSIIWVHSNVLNYFLVSFFLKYHGDFKENLVPTILELTQISTIYGEKKC